MANVKIAGVDVRALVGSAAAPLFPRALLTVGATEYEVRAVIRTRSARETYEGLLKTESVAVIMSPPVTPEPDAVLVTAAGAVFRMGVVAADPTGSVFRCEAYA